MSGCRDAPFNLTLKHAKRSDDAPDFFSSLTILMTIYIFSFYIA